VPQVCDAAAGLASPSAKSLIIPTVRLPVQSAAQGERYGCLGRFRKGACNNGRTIRRDDIERRVLAGLTDKLVSPEAVAVAVRPMRRKPNRQNHERRAQVEADRRSLQKINRDVNGILDAIEDGMYQPVMKARMSELEQQKAEV
jgi:site-specific DNA recombinase